MKHPIQNVYSDAQGVKRFEENEIVRHLVDSYPDGLNALAVKFRDDKDNYLQLMQLIGYSLCGFCEIESQWYDSTRITAAAERKKEK